ncbi:helix-turn-helix domain-containing protein [Paenirhodobacter populi]|uniref:HTH merR-type domain-containing protein n=1 Tax=Paenirhodobacter populi TaxID=2306993 RepID=A0A443J1T9_9RHOB|nr:helix-turn-helix domain-containing protein [Sinirhodobacter populi]RWR14306.1 hypothetical protein D2T33_03585 [Sinirhodobacter populi]
MKLELEHYTPSEAEEITQVAQTTVRNWRRAGHLARHDGHARYNIAELLVQTSMRTLVSRGVAPEVAKGYAGEIARAAFQSMIYSAKAYSEGVHKAAREEVGKISPERIEQVKAAAGEAFSLEMLEWADAQTCMMDAAKRTFGVSGLKAPTWFIIWANGELEFYYDGDSFEERFFSETINDEYVQGPVILFYLDALATMVIDRLPRPAIKLVGES